MDIRLNKNAVSRESPEAADIRLPSSFKKLAAAGLNGPMVSHAIGMKMWDWARLAYLASFLDAAETAAPAAAKEVDGRCEAANVSATVTSQVTGMWLIIISIISIIIIIIITQEEY